MKRLLCILMALGLLLSGCAAAPEAPATPQAPQTAPQATTPEELVEQWMAEMTLEEKIAQMLVIYYTGEEVDQTLLSAIREVRPGGFILMKENISSFDRTAAFIDTLQENSKIPMMISIDQEGGLVQRLKGMTDPAPTQIPAMAELGQTQDPALAKEVGGVMGAELSAIGFNMTFAPVVDLSSQKTDFIGSRSFGGDPQTVASLAGALAEGLEAQDVTAVYKHFPGHGGTKTDSHTDLPILQKSKEQLLKSDLIPFQSAIDRGAKLIMVGHIAVPSIAGDLRPACLSKPLVTDLLKEEMGFDGLVITDALNMGALTNTYSEEEIYLGAIEAGCDLLLMPNGSRKAVEIIKSGISEERIDQSVRKILLFKAQNLLDRTPADPACIGSTEHQGIMEKIK